MLGWLTFAAVLIVGMALLGTLLGSLLDDDTGTDHSATPTPAATDPAQAPVTLVSVIDGDTIVTSAGTVRIIGIDTPERGECGYEAATASIERALAAGDPVSLERPPGQNDRDRYDRLLRYVATESGADVGLMQLEAGHAVARYDSRDGYPAHPREAAYRAAQLATLGQDHAVITPDCHAAAVETQAPSSPAPTAAVPTAAVPTPAVTQPSVDMPWYAQYSSCARLKRNEVGHPMGPFNRDDPEQAAIYDWFANQTGNRGDGDGDGLACE